MKSSNTLSHTPPSFHSLSYNAPRTLSRLYIPLATASIQPIPSFKPIHSFPPLPRSHTLPFFANQQSINSYFLTFAANTPLSDQRNLSFTETRQRSPLYLATIVSIGARSLSRFETFHASLREALYIVSEMFMPDNDGSKLVSMLTIKAVILLGLYHSMPHLLLASGMLGFKMGLRTALDEYDELKEEDKTSKIGRTLIGKGRMMFVSYLWTAL